MSPSGVTELVEVFESATDRMRREWSENHGDWAHGLLNFLRGERENEIGLAEIVTTKLYAQSTPLEQSSLRFVAGQADQRLPLSADDTRILIERDAFILDYAQRPVTSPAKWVEQLANIPADVEYAKALDTILLPRARQFPMLRIFGWIWDRG